MKTKATKLLCLLLSALMLLGTLVACADPDDSEKESSSGGETEVVTGDPAADALEELGELDFGGEEFGILYQDSFESEIIGINGTVDKEGGASQIINDAVYKRNTLFEDRYKLKLVGVKKPLADMQNTIQNEATAPTNDFYLIDANLKTSASLATSGYLYNLLDLGVDIEGEWWDAGTASFVLEEGVYFMSGSINIADDNVTYALIFNKELYKKYAAKIANPYQTVRDWEWTLDYFNQIIQGISADNGDGTWNEKDTYGFITTWEYGNTFFLGSDLRYVINDENVDEPTLYLDTGSRMERALKVLELSSAIYHNNNATYMSPAGQENLGLAAFKENRGLFYSEGGQLPVHPDQGDGDRVRCSACAEVR